MTSPLLLIMMMAAGTANVFAQVMPFTLLPSGHILVQAEIEGKKGNFIFDTGAGINLFFKDFADNLSRKETCNFLTAYRATGEKIVAPLYKTSSIKFNSTTFTDVPYTTYPVSMAGINGLISLQMLGNTDFIIDYEARRIIFPVENLSGSRFIDIQLTTNADRSTDISTYVMINHEYKINVLLDSGAGDSSYWLSDKFIDVLKINRNNLKTIEKRSEFDSTLKTKFYTGNIGYLSNQFTELKSPKVVFVTGLIYEGKTSIRWLGKKLGFSLKNKRIYILD